MIEEKSLKTSAKRVVIYPKDIQVLTGKSERYALKLVSQIKRHFEKEKYQPLSIKDFCQYMGLNEDEVRNNIFI